MSYIECYEEHWHTVLSKHDPWSIDVLSLDLKEDKVILRIYIRIGGSANFIYYCFTWNNFFGLSWSLEEQDIESNIQIKSSIFNCCKTIGSTRILKKSRWINQICDDVLQKQKSILNHYVILTGWEIIEVLSTSEPEVCEF